MGKKTKYLNKIIKKIKKTASPKLQEIFRKIKELYILLVFGLTEEIILKWPYLILPSRKIFQRKPQYLLKRAPNFELHGLMFNPTYQNTKKIESPLLQTYRSKIRLKDYQGKKNIFLLFLPGNLSGRSQRLQNSIIELNENFNKFVENETEILIVVQSFSPEVRWNLNLAKVHGGLRNLKFPIIFDPWGLLFNSYNSQNDSKQKGKIETYTSYFINKEGIIRYIGYFDQQIKFDLPKTLEIIESLRS